MPWRKEGGNEKVEPQKRFQGMAIRNPLKLTEMEKQQFLKLLFDDLQRRKETFIRGEVIEEVKH